MLLQHYRPPGGRSSSCGGWVVTCAISPPNAFAISSTQPKLSFQATIQHGRSPSSSMHTYNQTSKCYSHLSIDAYKNFSGVTKWIH